MRSWPRRLRVRRSPRLRRPAAPRRAAESPLDPRHPAAAARDGPCRARGAQLALAPGAGPESMPPEDSEEPAARRRRNPRAITSPPRRPAGRPDGSAAVHLGELAGDAGVGVLGGRQPLAQRRPVHAPPCPRPPPARTGSRPAPPRRVHVPRQERVELPPQPARKVAPHRTLAAAASPKLSASVRLSSSTRPRSTARAGTGASKAKARIAALVKVGSSRRGARAPYLRPGTLSPAAGCRRRPVAIVRPRPPRSRTGARAGPARSARRAKRLRNRERRDGPRRCQASRQVLRLGPGPSRGLGRHPGRRVRRAGRALGLRQVHAAAHDRGPGGDQPAARSRSASASSTTCRRRTATSRWCSRTTPSIRT